MSSTLVELDLAELIFADPVSISNFDEEKLFAAATKLPDAAKWLFFRDLDCESHMNDLLKRQKNCTAQLQSVVNAAGFVREFETLTAVSLELKQFSFFLARVSWLGKKHLLETQDNYKVFKGKLRFS